VRHGARTTAQEAGDFGEAAAMGEAHQEQWHVGTPCTRAPLKKSDGAYTAKILCEKKNSKRDEDGFYFLRAVSEK
jgi:hypothetical protein